MEENHEDLLKEYILGGGNHFRVTGIDMYRDGGTIGIKWKYFLPDTTENEYYVDKDLSGLYRAFKKQDEVTDKVFKKYFLHTVKRYMSSLDFKKSLCENVVEVLNK